MEMILAFIGVILYIPLAVILELVRRRGGGIRPYRRRRGYRGGVR